MREDEGMGAAGGGLDTKIAEKSREYTRVMRHVPYRV